MELKELEERFIKLEERVQKLDSQLTFLRGAAYVAGACVLAFLGYTILDIPRQVKAQIGSDVVQRVEEFKKAYDDLAASADVARAKILGDNFVIGSIDSSGFVSVPNGTTDDWDILVVPQGAGKREECPNCNYDNALLGFNASVKPNSEKTKFATNFVFDWKFRNAPSSKDSGIDLDQKGQAGYILRRKSIK